MPNGFKRTELWKELTPDQHFRFIDADLDEIHRVLALREELLRNLDSKIETVADASAASNTKALRWLVALISTLLVTGATVAVVERIVR